MPRTPHKSIGGMLPTYLCVSAMNQNLTPRGRVVLIGDEAGEKIARALGLSPDARLTPPLGHAEMLARSVRRIARDFERVIVWNDELAPLLKGIQVPTELISTRPDLARRRVPSRVSIRVFERADRTAWESKNHEAELDTTLLHLIERPELPQCSHTLASLGIDPGTVSIGFLADRPRDIDARAIGFLMGLLDVSGFSLTAIVPEGASHLTSARRHHHGLGNHFRILIAQHPTIAMLPVFDVLIHSCYDGTGASTLIERLCENAGTPVVRLRSSGRAGLSRAPGVAGPVIEALDDILAQHAPDPIRTETEIHA